MLDAPLLALEWLLECELDSWEVLVCELDDEVLERVDDTSLLEFSR
ncbi:hypothetical protein [Marinimicrobium locisalis]